MHRKKREKVEKNPTNFFLQDTLFYHAARRDILDSPIDLLINWASELGTLHKLRRSKLLIVENEMSDSNSQNKDQIGHLKASQSFWDPNGDGLKFKYEPIVTISESSYPETLL